MAAPATPYELLRSLLLANATVVALVGTRVYPLRIAQGEPLPAIAYQQVGGNNDRCSSYGRFRYQISMFSAGYVQAVALSEAVLAALDGFEDGEILIEADGAARDQFSEGSEVYYRTHDYFIDFPNPQTNN